MNDFKISLEQESWFHLYTKRNMNEAFAFFLETFLFSFETCFPKRFFYDKNSGKDWVNNKVKFSSAKLKDLNILKNINPEMKLFYNSEKQKHVKLVESVKKQYYQNAINSSSDPVKTSWKVVSALSGKINHKKNITITKEGTYIIEPSTVANELNNYFKNAPVDITDKLKKNINVSAQKSKINEKNHLFRSDF